MECQNYRKCFPYVSSADCQYVWGDDWIENFNDLKNLYEDGYRFIYQDGDEGNRNVYLKNFENEKSTVVNIQDENEFSQFQDYISNLRMS